MKNICNKCKKEIQSENEINRIYRKGNVYYKVETHHNDWGNDSIDSYENYNICSCKCLKEFIDNYYNEDSDDTYCLNVKKIRI